VNKQSHIYSLIEGLGNVVVGLGVALIANHYILPLVFNQPVPLDANIKLAAIYTIISLIRSYLLRRIFEYIRVDLRRN
jgi:hypothetical protein